MNKNEAITRAKARIAIEELEKKIQLPSDLTENDLVALKFISDTSIFETGQLPHWSPQYKKLLNKRLLRLWENGMISRDEIDRLTPILYAYQENELDPQFSFLHAFLSLISRIPDQQAENLIKKQGEASFHERARKNLSVGRRIPPKKWGPPDDGDWDGRNRDYT